MKMKRITAWAFLALAFLSACSYHKTPGRKLSVAKGNISFDLPHDLAGYKAHKLFSPCSLGGEEYVSTIDYFFNSDKTVTVLLQIDPYVNAIQGHLFDEESQMQKTKTSDSTAVLDKVFNNGYADTIEIDYRLTHHARQYYEKTLAVQGRYRTLIFRLRAPDNKQMRSKIEAIRKSIQIEPKYLTERVGIESN